MVGVTADGEIRKVVRAMSMYKIQQVIKSHEQRGWKLRGKIMPHGKGYGCLLIYNIKE